MRISDWSSDVCSSDLDIGTYPRDWRLPSTPRCDPGKPNRAWIRGRGHDQEVQDRDPRTHGRYQQRRTRLDRRRAATFQRTHGNRSEGLPRSEEHTSELQSLMRISYAVFCLKKKKNHTHKTKLQLNHHKQLPN